MASLAGLGPSPADQSTRRGRKHLFCAPSHAPHASPRSIELNIFNGSQKQLAQSIGAPRSIGLNRLSTSAWNGLCNHQTPTPIQSLAFGRSANAKESGFQYGHTWMIAIPALGQRPWSINTWCGVDSRFGVEPLTNLVAVDPPAKSSTFWGFGGHPNLISTNKLTARHPHTLKLSSVCLFVQQSFV